MLVHLCIFFLTFSLTKSQYDLSNVFPGIRMSVIDDMFISASNAFSNFAVVMHPFRPVSAGGPIRCNMRYNDSDRFVHSVAAVGISKTSNDSERFIAVFAAERMSTTIPKVCIGTIAKSTCLSQTRCTNVGPGGTRQEYFLIGVDTNGDFAYGFTSSFVFKLDIYANQIVMNFSAEEIWPRQGFIPHGLDVADTWAVVAGYGYTDPFKKNYAALGCFINLTTLISVNCVSLVSETTFLIPSNVVYYNDLYELNVAIRGRKVLVGVQRLETVVVLESNGTGLALRRTHRLSYSDALSFARVVDWADDTSIAVLVLNPSQTPWAKSQIFVFDENSVNLTTPVFTFPNNQQIVGTRLSQPSFARFGITAGGNMGILTNNADILIVPVTPPGSTAVWVNTTDRVFVFYYESKFCIGGTYKNRTSLGPCQICPPHTRNPGNLGVPVLRCLSCLNSSQTTLCPLASLSELERNRVASYSQATAYPESPDTTDIEDILIKNVFQLDTTNRRCLVISPLLWTLVVSGLCMLVLLTMVAIKLSGIQRFNDYRKKVKEIFKHTDIIGEGEMWAGGLATLAIVVLVSFSYWFSASFINRYPIEDVHGPATFACDDRLINSQFSTGLELLSLPKSNDSQPIFDLLDEQKLNLTVELINSGFQCDAISVQENFIGTKHVPLSIECARNQPDAITVVNIPLPRHQTTVQVNMSGPFWVGAVRFCLRGHGKVNGSVALQKLDVCQVYFTENEAIGRATSVPIVFIRNINMTQPLHTSESTKYSGLWMPTFGSVSLSDEPYYVEFGNYLRYTTALTIIQVELDERPFYIKNFQRPIVRTAELIFHGLLFTSLCIELFAFSFLLIKLFLVPLLRSLSALGQRCCPSAHRRHEDEQSSNGSNATPLAARHSMYKIEAEKTMTNETDLDVSRVMCRL